jgi:hypothetical protein
MRARLIARSVNGVIYSGEEQGCHESEKPLERGAWPWECRLDKRRRPRDEHVLKLYERAEWKGRPHVRLVFQAR